MMSMGRLSARQIEVKDDTYEERQKKKNANVIPIASAKTG